MTLDYFKNKPDMWGRNVEDPEYGLPPENDEYWTERKHPYFREDIYWLEREVEFWYSVADSFWFGVVYGDPDFLETCISEYGYYFTNEEDREWDE